MAKTFFKWPGSKAWLVSRIQGAFSDEPCRVVEPFVGSSAFFLGGCYSEALLGDTNKHVVMCLAAVRDEPKKVLKYLSRLQNNQEDFIRVRNEVPLDYVSAAGRLIFLTNTSWGGLYRENLAGQFNVPFGKNGRVFYSEESILIASDKLKGAEINNVDFSETLKLTKAGDLVFVDAPYVKKGQSGIFDRYLSTRFSWEDQVRLAKLLTAKRMESKKILVTCAADSDLYGLFPGWQVFEFDRRNSMIAYVSKARYRKEALLISPSFDSHFDVIEGYAEVALS